MSQSVGINFKKSSIDALIAGFMALILFGPIVGVVLDGYSFNAEFDKVAWMVLVVIIGRFAMSSFFQTEKGIAMAFRYANSNDGATVLPPGHKSKMMWIIPLVIVIGLLVPFIASKYVLTVVILGLILRLAWFGSQHSRWACRLIGPRFCGLLCHRRLWSGIGL